MARTIFVDVTMPRVLQTAAGSRAISKMPHGTCLKQFAEDIKKIVAAPAFAVKNGAILNLHPSWKALARAPHVRCQSKLQFLRPLNSS